ncbi:MAG: glycosyltransferase [Erysipelothrix sp.]|nr:glycosyltransferase [Erysipelothrix sp.]
MKVMFINSVIDYGSTGKIVRDLAEGLKADGHQVLIVYGRNKPLNDDDTFSISNKRGFYYHVIMTRLLDRHGLHSKKATKKLINKIKDFKPNVIHLHNLHGYYLNYPMLMNFLKQQKDIKIVWTLHDLWAVCGSVAHFSYYGCKEWRDGCVIANNPRVYPQSNFILREKQNFYLKKEVFSGFNDLTIITVSDWEKNIIKQTFLKQYKIIRIYNGLDFDHYQKARFNKKTPKTLFGTASDWNNEKNLIDYIKLADIMPKNYQMTLTGLSDEMIRILPNNIKGLPRLDSEKELIKLYAKSSIFLNLSLQETMGMTTIEALASGTPVVVYDKTAVPEVIDATVGKVVEAKNINALLKAVIEVEARKIDPETCYEFAKKRYNKTQMITYYKNVYFERSKR